MAEPAGVEVIQVEAACDMLAAVEASLPADVAAFTAAVADWRVDGSAGQKIKKGRKGTPNLKLVENPDILATVSQLPAAKRPPLVIGFAAETEQVIKHATAKRVRKGCDWIVANDVSDEGGAMGGASKRVSSTVRLSSSSDMRRRPRGAQLDRAEGVVLTKFGVALFYEFQHRRKVARQRAFAADRRR